MKEFEVFPKLISASNLFFIYRTTLKAEANNLLRESNYSKTTINEKGQIFTISKFIECLVAASRIILPKLRQIDNPEQW
jgi:hypothetical protein